MTNRFAILSPCWLALAFFPPTARAGEAYYLLIFSFQGDAQLPRCTHTFATFVKAKGEGGCPEASALESHTISWSPVTRAVRVMRLYPEQGINLDLEFPCGGPCPSVRGFHAGALSMVRP